MFPQGGPGVALLLLRVSVVANLILNPVISQCLLSNRLFFAGAVLVSAFVIIGFLTPAVSAAVGTAAIACLVTGLHSFSLVHGVSVLDAGALALLGPGAYSLDSWLFGRRVTVLPPRPDKQRD